MKFSWPRKNIFIYIVGGIIVLVVIAFLISWWNHHTLSSYIKEITKADVEELMCDNNISTETPCQTNNRCDQLNNIKTTVNLQIGVSEDSTFVYNTSLVRKDNTLCDCNNQNENKPHRYDINKSQDSINYLLDILTKSNNLVGANELTFFFTFIIAVLSIFFGYKTVVVERALVEFEQIKNSNDNLKKEAQNEKEGIQQRLTELNRMTNNTQALMKKTKLFNTHTIKYDHFLIRIASIYNMGVMIGNSSMALSSDNSEEENQNISIRVGGLCSRLSLTCDDINTRLNDKKHKLDFLTKDEKENLDTYISDTLGELERSQKSAKDAGIEALSNIIEDKIDILNDIRDTLNRVEICEDIV